MKTFSPSRLGVYLSVLIGWFAIILSAEAQVGQVTVRGRKASDSGLLARVRDGANPGKLQAAKGGLGQAAMTAKAEFRTKGLMLVGKNAQGAAAAMTSAELELKAKELMATGLYEYVEPDWIVTVSQVPTDTAYTNGSLWGLRNTGQSGGAVGVDVNAHAAWAVTTGSPTVIVGVVDTGIRFTHQDLVGNIWVNPGEIAANGIDDDANGYIDDIHGINGITNSGNPMDDNNHGTHCAGTIGATANNAGQIVGVAWNVKLMGLKFLSASGSGNTSDAIKCIDYGVAKGAHILSNSWGGGGYSQALRDSIAAASNAGVLFVAAAGNSSSNNDVTQNYPSNYDPANVVAVAAVDRTGALASFSSYGATTVDVGAPGVAILSSTAASDSSYDSFNGTSMATPHVAGVAALIKSQFPTATMLEIKNRLMATTRPLASLAGRTVSGGIVDAHAALTVAADGVLELRASAATSPLRNGVSTAFYVTVSDLTPVTGATVTGALGAGTPVAFLDNGVAPDVAANDGTYSANLTVPATGSSTTLNVTASNGGAPATAAFPFSIISPPGNDNFGNRVLLAAGTTQATGSNRLSTFEVGEPQFPSVAGTKSVWWEWAAGTTGSITVTTSGSDYDTTLAIYSGSGTLASLVHLGSNDDFSGLASSVTFSATSGQRYYVQVNGYAGDEGSITLNYPSPANVNSPPVIVTQPVGAILVAGDPLALSVTASGTAPLTYQWRLNGSNIGGATSASYSVASVAEVDEGNYTVTITNAFGNLTSATAFVGVDPISVRPSNDLFVNAETLAGAAGRVNGTNLRASAETGEPNHAAASTPVESVWYRWTAPAAGTLSLDTYGSSLDTTLAAYTGAAVNALTQRAANNDAGGVQSFISVAVTAGEVLQIAVDGAGTAESIFSLNYFFQPTVPGLANDAFASRTVVSGAGGTFTGSNIGATGEVGEAVHEASAPPTASVWWSWTAPANGVAVIDTLGSDFDTIVAVYTGTDVTALTLVASNDDAGGPQSRVGFLCTAGTAYVIAVDGRGAAQGLVSLNITSGATEPEIAVEQPVGTGLVDGGVGVSWGNVATTENVTRTFTVRNTGGARLTGLMVQIEGTNAADFVLTTPPATAVNGGASTTFSIRFTPAGLGAHTALLRLSSNDGDEHPFDISLSGTGVPPAPEIVLEEPVGTGLVDGSATAAFGSVVVGSSASKTYTVRNTGNATLSGLAVAFSGANAADFSVTTAPAATVAPGGNTTFTVRFAPVGFGARSAAMMLASNDADENPFDVALTGSGIVTPPVARTLNATDRGWYDVSGTHDPANTNYLTGIASDEGPQEFRSFFIFSLPALGPNETVISAELRLVNPSGGFLSTEPTENFEIHAVSTAPATLIAGTAGVAGFTDLLDGAMFGGKNVSTADNGTTVVFPLNGAALAEIRVKAGSQVAFGGSLTTLAGGGVDQRIFGMTGSATTDTQLVFTTVTSYTDTEIAVEQPVGTGLTDGTSSVSFGGIAPGTTADRTFTIRNVGIYDLTGLGITVTGANAADFTITASPSAPLTPAGATTFTVRFAPTAGGTKNATLSIASNDPDENPFDIALTGIGVVPAPEIVLEQPVGTNLVDGTAVVDFGTRSIGANGSLTFTVRNTGTANLSGLGIVIDGANAAEFSIISSPTAPVIPGASTTFTVRFAPTAAGVRTAALHLASNDDDETPFDIALSGRGYTAPVGLDFQILSLGTTGTAVVDHDVITGDDRGGIAVTMDRVFVTGDSATSRHALNLTGGASIGRVSNGLCSDIGSGTAYVLAHSGVETTGSGTVSQLIQLDPLTGALTGTVIPLSTSFTITSGSGVFSGNGRVVVHNRTRVYDILVPSGVVTDLGTMIVPAWYSSESWASWGVAEFFNGELHLAYRAASGATIVRSRVPDGLVQTISTFTNLGDMASWTVSPVTGRWYFHHENGSQFGGSSETLGYADATFAMGPPTQPPAITSPLAATAFTGSAFTYQISANRSPTSYNAAGLPSGLSVNTATGIISGSVAVAGVYPVTISATNIIGTTSATLTLTVLDTLTTFFDDFDPGIDMPLWSGFGGTVTANTAGQAAGVGSTGNSMHFDGSGNRFATTVAIDTRGTDAMSFLFALANGSSSIWENADAGEEVVLEYSTDGVAFTQVGGPYSNRVWQLTTVALPMAARTASTRFRWRQLSNSGVGFDHWAIEDVRIIASVIPMPEIAVEQPAGTGLTDGVSTVSYGPVAVGTNASLTFTVRNSGSANLTGLVPTINGANAGDFTVTTAPASTVAPGSTTTFIVRFAPGAAGARVAALHIASNDADENPFDIALAGTGFILAPEIAVEQPVDTNLSDGVSTVAFGTATISTSAQRTFTIRNTGTAPLTGIAVAFGGSHAVDWTLTAAPASTVAAGASTTFTARFSPTVLGVRSATLQISSNDGDENPFDLVLTGFAANETTVLVNFDGVFAPPSFAEQTRPTSDYAPGSITFTNTTMEVLNEGGGFGVGGHSSPNFLAWSANPGTNNSVTMVFPVPVSGFSLKAAVGLTDTATVSAYDSSDVLLYSTTVPLSATLTTVALPSSQVSRVVFTTAGTVGVIDDISYLIIVPPEIAIEQPAGVNLTDGASTVSFGPAAMPVTRQFTVRNIGDGQSLNVSAPTINGAHAADFTITTLPASTVAPTGFTTFAVRFTPSAPGARTAALHLGNNDADENPFDIALTATAITPASGFDTWLPAGLSDRTPLGIPHQDGVPNLLKYAFNLNPNIPDHRVMSPGGTAGLPSIGRTQAGSVTVFRFEFIRRIGSGLAYTPQKRDSLTAGDWTALSSLPVATPVDEFWERVVYEEPVNPLTVPACYGRVRVQLP